MELSKLRAMKHKAEYPNQRSGGKDNNKKSCTKTMKEGRKSKGTGWVDRP